MSENTIVQSLIDMGFTAENSEFAVKKCKSTNVQEVLDWMLQHTNDIDELRTAAESDNAVTEEAKSLKCNDCGKLFKSSEEAEFHAVKSGHVNFDESTEEKKPLTEEEKREKLKELEKVMKERRRAREEQEKLDNLEREKRRIQSGKEMVEVKKKLEDMEMKKMVDQRKREKIEEQLARERVRRQIEEDRNDRKMKFSNAAEAQSAPQPTSPSVAKSTTSSASYSESKIQVRLLNGSCVTQSFSAKDCLSAVRLFLESNYPDLPIPFSLATTYPRRDFTSSDFEKTLESLNLVPTAVLIVKKTIS